MFASEQNKTEKKRKGKKDKKIPTHTRLPTDSRGGLWPPLPLLSPAVPSLRPRPHSPQS